VENLFIELMKRKTMDELGVNPLHRVDEGEIAG